MRDITSLRLRLVKMSATSAVWRHARRPERTLSYQK
jgi:hypothetical protein